MQKQQNYSLARTLLMVSIIYKGLSLINLIQYEWKERNNKDRSGFAMYENRVEIAGSMVEFVVLAGVYILVGRLR